MVQKEVFNMNDVKLLMLLNHLKNVKNFNLKFIIILLN